MFCLIVKGDIDTETNTGAMRSDWEHVQSLARELGNKKWQYRALAQLGIAAFYDGDLEGSRTRVGTALAAATDAGDIGAQIRILTIVARGLVQSKMFEQALASAENIVKLAAHTPDAGYQFSAKELCIEAFIGLRRFDAAQKIADEALKRATEAGRVSHQGSILYLAADIAFAQSDHERAIAILKQAIDLGKSAGLTRLLADTYARATEIYRKTGDLAAAEDAAASAAASTQACGDMWAVPQRLQELAELHLARGRYQDADGVYDRAETFLDAMIGSVSTVMDKTAIITASSQIYAQHFALVAQRFDDPVKAYSIIEQVRGRVASDLLASGTVSTPEAKGVERAISQLRLKLMSTRSTNELRSLRDQILMVEQTRWVNSGVTMLKRGLRENIGIEQVQKVLPASAVLLEYVLAEPNSYCLAISGLSRRLIPLTGKSKIETLVSAYLKAVKAKKPAVAEARSLYDSLLRPIREAVQKSTLIVVRDGSA